MLQHMRLLGLQVSDKITGFSGVVTSVSFDLYGCVQCVVTPPMDDKDNLPADRWFDAKRLETRSDVPVMAVPSFDATPAGAENGPQSKPSKPSLPARC